MTLEVVAKARSFLIRSLAVVVLMLTAAWGSLTSSVLSVPAITSLLSIAGVSSFVLTTTSSPAQAQRRRRRRYRRGRWYYYYW